MKTGEDTLRKRDCFVPSGLAMMARFGPSALAMVLRVAGPRNDALAGRAMTAADSRLSSRVCHCASVIASPLLAKQSGEAIPHRVSVTTATAGLAIAVRTLVCMVVVLMTVPLTAEAGAGSPGGHLFIIGGGRRGPELMKEYVRLAGGPAQASILVLPMASGDGDTTGLEMAEEFRTLGVRTARSLFITREMAMTPGVLDQLKDVTGVYFTGGDQSRITKELVGTPVQDRLKELYRSGAVIGGTSAGAAIMSAVMLTGDEKLNRDTVNGFTFIRRDNIVVTEGLGFLATVIVDQHFIRRKRMNRLISVVLEHAPHVGVGIDEATAVIVSPDSTFRVMGRGSVLVLDASQAANVRNDDRGNMGADGMRMHILLDGDAFDMRRLAPLQQKDIR